jgi:hypothetical protein
MPTETVESRVGYLQWGPILAGAFAAAGLAFVLHAFAAAIGLSVSSTAPTWRDASFALLFLSGLYLVLASLASYGFGAYLAGYLRSPLSSQPKADDESRDGAHGLLVWAIATLLTVAVAFAAAVPLARLAAPSSGAVGPSTSVAGENIIAYDLDRLFRVERRPPAAVMLEQSRAEAARILLNGQGHRGIPAEDRAYLVQLVSAQTGLPPPEADKRVAAVTAQAIDNLSRARRSAVLLAFMAGAAALLGAVVAWYAACVGGRQRDSSVAAFYWNWADWNGKRRT